MKCAKLALVTVVLCGSLAACKPEAEPMAPAADAPAPAAEAPAPAVETAPATDPAVTDPMASPVPDVDSDPMDDAAEEDEDTPHSGGDKVAPAAPPAN